MSIIMTSLRAVCSTDVRAEAPTDFREKTDRHRQGCVQKPRSRSSIWADHKLRCNSHVLRHLSCSLERLGALATIPAPADASLIGQKHCVILHQLSARLGLRQGQADHFMKWPRLLGQDNGARSRRGD